MRGHSVRCAPLKYGDADGIHVFLQCSGGDHFGRLTQAGVDDFHSGIAKRACDDLRTAVMAVKPGLATNTLIFLSGM
jgi:hypothetical protein